jgi:predicted secreted protein
MSSTESDDSIELRVGEKHELRLAGHGTSGYGWVPEVAGSEVAEVKPAGVEPLEPGGDVGASVDEAFTVHGLKPGVTDVRFALRRPWEPADQPPADEVTVKIRVI